MRGGYTPPPDGTYQVRLATCAGGVSKASNKQMVSMTVEIVQGALAGRELYKRYVTQPIQDPKTGKWNSRGIADAREDIRALGLQPPAQFPTNANAAAQIIGQAFQQAGVFTVIVKTTVKIDKQTQARDEYTDIKVAAPGGVAVTAAMPGQRPFGL
jgi:hypothetical protein